MAEQQIVGLKVKTSEGVELVMDVKQYRDDVQDVFGQYTYRLNAKFSHRGHIWSPGTILCINCPRLKADLVVMSVNTDARTGFAEYEARSYGRYEMPRRSELQDMKDLIEEAKAS